MAKARQAGRKAGIFYKVADLDAEFPHCRQLVKRGYDFVVIDMHHATYIPFELLLAEGGWAFGFPDPPPSPEVRERMRVAAARAVSTAERLDEYATVWDAKEKAGGRGLLYARFVLDELKPFIDHHYRTKPGRVHTGVAGSSLGGLISLLMARHFSRCFSVTHKA